MALLSQQLQRFLLTKKNYNSDLKANKKNPIILRQRKLSSSFKCSAIAIEAPSSLAGVAGIKWGLYKLQGARDEMEDEALIVQPDNLHGFSFAAVFDGHAGSSSVQFLREELYKECAQALKGELLLSGKDFDAIKSVIEEAFENVDSRLLKLLAEKEDDKSGATATVMLVGNDRLYIAHLGDSSVVLSRSGKAEVLTDAHRPYGSNKASLQEIRRINEAGGWIINGRICGDIAVSRAFGDIRFKTKKNEMLEGGVQEGRWAQKFASRVKFNADLLVSRPDIFQVVLGAETELLLLASDGLWDYINSSEALAIVRNEMRQHGNIQLACESLAKAALDRRSQDNITIIIADLGTPKPEEEESETLEATRKRNKWENDDYICRGHILNGMSDPLFDIYQYVESAKILWDELETKYMAEDASSKKFLVSNFNSFKMIDSRPIMDQFHEIQRILGSFKQHNINMDETFVVSSIIDKLPPSWKDVRNTLKHKKDDMNVEQLGAHLRIEEDIRVQDELKDTNPKSSTVNMVEDGKYKESSNPKKRASYFTKGNKGKKPKFGGGSQRGCWECGKPGHFKKDCTIWKKKMSKRNGGNGTSQSQAKADTKEG